MPVKTFSLWICLLFLVLAGCASQSILSDAERNSQWQKHQAEIHKLADWELAGRIAVRQGDQSWSASLFWQQTDLSFEIQIIAPLAQGSAIISGNGQSVLLKTSDNQEFRDNDIVALMDENLGWSLPVNALRYWTTGIPEPGQSSQGLIIDSNGRSSSFNQGGWKVDYHRYDLTRSVALPARMTLSRSDTEIRLVINRWDIES